MRIERFWQYDRACILRVNTDAENRRQAVEMVADWDGQLFYPLAFKPGDQVWVHQIMKLPPPRSGTGLRPRSWMPRTCTAASGISNRRTVTFKSVSWDSPNSTKQMMQFYILERKNLDGL